MKTMTKYVCQQPFLHDQDETALMSLNINCDYINMEYYSFLLN